MKLERVLEEFGLTNREARVYLAALELGESSIQDIAKKAGIERTGTYYIIETLGREGIVSKIEKDKKTFFAAAPPENLVSMAQKKRELLEEHFPELKALYNISDKKPKVRLYEGMEGIKSVFEETLRLKKGEEILAFTAFDVAHLFISDWGHEYVKRRSEKGIFARDIAQDSPEARDHQQHDKDELRETRLIPAELFPFTNEIDILKDRVMIVSFRETIGLVIESKDIAVMLRSIFELAWLGAKGFQKNPRT